MKRRQLLIAAGALLPVLLPAAYSQSSAPRRIAFVHPGTRAGYHPLFEVFRQALRESGYVEGRDIVIDPRWAEGRLDLLTALAAEAVAQEPAVIVTAGSEGIAAMKKQTSSIPIVFATAGRPVEQGFVASLQRPGGNVTGVVVYAGLVRKIVEITREALPSVKRIGLLLHDGDRASKNELELFEETARALNFAAVVVSTSGPEDFDRALGEMSRRKIQAVIVPQLIIFQSNRQALIDRALKWRLVVLSPILEFAESGGLLSYGTPREENYRRAGALTANILRGMRPADLPVEQPQNFQLIVNRRTAQMIGVKFAPQLTSRVDRIVE
jgi:putative ABC transport system substrate-binding protein